MLSSPIFLYKNLRLLQKVAMQKQGASVKGWRVTLNREQYAYLKRTKMYLRHFPLNRVILSGSPTSILAGSP
jgi:hypothetical protein